MLPSKTTSVSSASDPTIVADRRSPLGVGHAQETPAGQDRDRLWGPDHGISGRSVLIIIFDKVTSEKKSQSFATLARFGIAQAAALFVRPAVGHWWLNAPNASFIGRTLIDLGVSDCDGKVLVAGLQVNETPSRSATAVVAGRVAARTRGCSLRGVLGATASWKPVAFGRVDKRMTAASGDGGRFATAGGGGDRIPTGVGDARAAHCGGGPFAIRGDDRLDEGFVVAGPPNRDEPSAPPDRR